MIKLLHIGVTNNNLGDIIAVKNVQRAFMSERNDIEFSTINIETFWKKNNNPEYIIKKIKDHNPDGIVIGGGGLIEYYSYESLLTNQKLPLNEYIIQECKIPIFLYGIGINTFRGNSIWPEPIQKILKDVLSNVTECSLRNDGSIEKSKKLNIYNENISEIPDPGLLYHIPKEEKYDSLTKGVFQPVENSNHRINKNRFLMFESYIKNIPKSNNMEIFPHTKKDFNFKGKYLLNSVELNSFSNLLKIDTILKKYMDFDYSVSMRGHGQLITIGMNIPGIYISTQDKITDFSIKNGFSEYNVDVLEQNWISKFEDMINKLKYDKKYKRDWYEIRKQNIIKWNLENSEFVKKCISHI